VLFRSLVEAAVGDEQMIEISPEALGEGDG